LIEGKEKERKSLRRKEKEEVEGEDDQREEEYVGDQHNKLKDPERLRTEH